MAPNPHFTTVESWEEATAVVDFEPHVPAYTADCGLRALEIWTRDHELREVGLAQRVLEAHYGRFVFAQSRPGEREAARLALETSYGPDSVPGTGAGPERRVYPLGPPPGPDDVDGRAPAVVVWADGARFYLLASEELEAEVLLRIADSIRSE